MEYYNYLKLSYLIGPFKQPWYIDTETKGSRNSNGPGLWYPEHSEGATRGLRVSKHNRSYRSRCRL